MLQNNGMQFAATHGPLSGVELDRLQDLIAARPRAMNIEAMDGFFSAVIAGPEVVMPSDCFPEVLGGGIGDGCSSIAEVEELASLMMRRWNEIARALANDEASLPILLEGKNRISHANDWADGFIRGTCMSGGWDVLLADEDYGGCMLAALILHHERDTDPTMRPPEITPEKREDLIAHLAAGLVQAYRYFRSDAYIAAEAALASEDLGRNASCPCGSGKRYKRCCGRVT